jgi:hypothetical protein
MNKLNAHEKHIMKENVKFVVLAIVMVAAGLLIAGLFDEYEGKKYDKAYKEGYEAALEDHGIDE